MHLILSLDQLDILNPSAKSFINNHGQNKPLYIEVSCRIEDINYIYDNLEAS